jgi:hypothetical protein
LEVYYNFLLAHHQADVEIGVSNRRTRTMEDELEQVTAKWIATKERLEDIAKAADECERYFLLGLHRYRSIRVCLRYVRIGIWIGESLAP